MQARHNFFLFTAAFLGLVTSSSFASAAPTNARSIELAPASEPSEPSVSEDQAETEPVEMINFACLSQCAREFTQCLSTDCSDEYCQEQYLECKSHC